ncbi:MAG: DUF4398 domain-containing protein, partial [Dokdonella sp.]|uniref:DUF4398 domain-containing protein n=1 Tax=Dokdonella sp. TaxID=2291710 RepID=UPI003264A9F1
MTLHIPHWRFVRSASLVVACLLLSSNAFARDDEYQRLSDRFDRLVADPAVAQHAPAQLDRARASLAALKDAKRSQRDEMAYVAERRIEIARVSAEARSLEDQRVSLQRENDRLQLA